jgi:hypothetical protein
MVGYVQELLRGLVKLLDPSADFEGDISSRFAAVAEELDRIDPRDLTPSAQARFVNARRLFRGWARLPTGYWPEIIDHIRDPRTAEIPRSFIEVAELAEVPRHQRFVFTDPSPPWSAAKKLIELAKSLCEELVGLLDSYGGPGCNVESRSFAWLKNASLREIVERDYRELALKLFPAGAWKSTVVLAGSILEAVLYDRLTRDSRWIKKAMAAKSAHKKAGGVVRDIKKNSGNDEWNLDHLIKVAVELGVLAEQQDKVVDQALRDYRNFIHPHKERKAGHAISEGHAGLAFSALKVVCDHLEQTA